jgi:Protein of unknown function (DUF1566)
MQLEFRIDLDAKEPDQTPVPAAPRIDRVMPDGTVYAGISPDTGRAMYAMPADVSLTMTFNGATEYAQGLNAQEAHGHDDWRVPTKDELKVLFNNRAKIGGFDLNGSGPLGHYWSSSPYCDASEAWTQRFSDGLQDHYHKGFPATVRLVRSEAPEARRSKEPGNRPGKLIL